MQRLWLALAFVGLVAAGAGADASQSSAAAAPTFARDIAPVVLTHCAPCHYAGGSAPFPLLTYADVRGRARQIVTAVTRRAMPPWKPEPGFGAFAGERRLSDAQVDLFQRWLAAGAPPGPLEQLPAPSAHEDGWTLGPPDLIVRLSAPYRLDAIGTDRLRHFVLPVPTSEVRHVKAWQFKTSSPAVVHHATLTLDSTRASRRLDDADPRPGYEGLIPLSAHNPEGYFLGWTPGQTPYVAPDRMAWRLDAGDDLVAMLHLMPDGREHDVDLSIGLYFAGAPPVDRPVMIRLNRQDIDIPPGDRSYTVADSYTLPVDVEVYGVQPHAHNLAREVSGTATLPDGTRRWLIYIRDWDFHWQDVYRLAEPLALPAGTTLRMEFRYDNSDRNPRNPFRPPRQVTYGQRTSEEMGDLWIQVLPRHAADRPALARSVRVKLLPQSISGHQMMLRADPGNVGLHDDLALLYVEAGALDQAAEQFAESLRLSPAVPAASYNLGNALLGLRRFDEAQTRFRAAIQLAPDYGLAHQGLAVALAATGHDDEAAGHFEAAARLIPGADVHYQLAALRQRQGRDAEALRQYRVALGLRPDWPAVQLAHAWLLATTVDPSLRDPREALRLAEKAVSKADQPVRALDVLAAALAASGEFVRAEAAVGEALRRAEADEDVDAVRMLRDRQRLYAGRRPYVGAGPVR